MMNVYVHISIFKVLVKSWFEIDRTGVATLGGVEHAREIGIWICMTCHA